MNLGVKFGTMRDQHQYNRLGLFRAGRLKHGQIGALCGRTPVTLGLTRQLHFRLQGPGALCLMALAVLAVGKHTAQVNA